MSESGRPTDEEFFTHKAPEENPKPSGKPKPSDFDDVPLAEEEPEPTDEEDEGGDEEPSKPSLVDKFKKLPKRTQLIVGVSTGVVLAAALTVYLLFFFGGDEKKRYPPAQASQAQRQRPPKKPAAKPVPGEEETDEAAENGKPPAPEEPPEEPAEEPLPKRPEDFAAWKAPDDYLAARAEDDPQLEGAVAYLGEACRGNANAPQAADLLAGLLVPPEPPEQAAPKPGSRPARPAPSRSQGATKLTEVIVAALVSLDHAHAREILMDLLSGEVPSEDDAATVGAVLGALASAGGLVNEGLLFRAFTEADELRPPPQSSMTAETLRQRAYEAFAPVASERLRIELAKHLMQPSTPLQRRKVFSEMLYAVEPKNVAAQMYLWQVPGLDTEIGESLSKHFLARSSAAMAYVLGLPDQAIDTKRRPTTSRTPARTPAEPVDEAAVNLRMTELLWGPWFVGQLQERLDRADSLDGHADLIVLGATIPVDSMRATVFDALEDNWEDGSKSLKSAGLDGKLVLDPALLLSLKALPRSVAREMPRTQGRPSRSRTPGRGTRPKSGLPKTIQEREKTQQEWMQTSEEMVRIWCRRLHAKSLAQAEAARLAGQTPPRGQASGSLAKRAEFALEEGSQVTAECHQEYPGSLADRLKDVPPGPAIVDYLRIEKQDKPLAVLGYYRRQLGVRDATPVKDGAWLDLVRGVPQTDRQRSIDVLITRLDPSTQREENEPEPLLIEVLAIEAKDPTGG